MGTEYAVLGAGLPGHSKIPAAQEDEDPGERVHSPSVPREQDLGTERQTEKDGETQETEREREKARERLRRRDLGSLPREVKN